MISSRWAGGEGGEPTAMLTGVEISAILNYHLRDRQTERERGREREREGEREGGREQPVSIIVL